MRIIISNPAREPLEAAEGAALEKYRLSSFCIEERTDESVLICHAATGEMVLLSDQEYEKISSGAALEDDWARKLAARMFLVEADLDERAMVDKERMEALREKEGNGAIVSYTILPTTRCNARCFYCYEQGIAQKNMSEQTALDTADFIAENCRGQKVQLSWFGGEPTLAHPIISLICKHLDEKDVEYQSSMISNGLLLDASLVQTAKEKWKLESVQITIDGTEAIYNETKNYKGCVSNPFEKVLANIGCMLENGIRVSIRINLGLHNYDDVSKLIDLLDVRFPERKRLSVYVHEIDHVYDARQHGELIEKTAALNRRLMEKRMHTPQGLPSLRMHCCMADSDEAVMINPDGQIGKCEHYAYEKQIGSIYSEQRDADMIAAWKQRAVQEACASCPLYASCYTLKWCNGGLACSESAVNSKLASTRNTMRMMYDQWKEKIRRLRTELEFELSMQMDLRTEDGELLADFRRDGEVETLALNNTGRDILCFLRERHSFTEIVDMLLWDYSADAQTIRESVEDYLMKMLRSGIIAAHNKTEQARTELGENR